jgi:hypothetical protein
LTIGIGGLVTTVGIIVVITVVTKGPYYAPYAYYGPYYGPYAGLSSGITSVAETKLTRDACRGERPSISAESGGDFLREMEREQ